MQIYTKALDILSVFYNIITCYIYLIQLILHLYCEKTKFQKDALEALSQ